VLRATLVRRLGDFELACALEAAAGAPVVVVGESGSGKTTLLRLLAGLDHPDNGRIEVGGRVWYDGAGSLFVPPDLRPVGYVSQNYALFPHLDAIENVAFGLRGQGMARAAARARALAMLERLGVGDLAGRRPRQLSGGQQQRVALGRALILEPEVLLLDEPLSALDVETRHAVRGELRQLLGTLSCATVLVTHSPLEALVFGERIVVLERGRVAQVGDRAALLRQPRTRYVATLLGLNLLPGRVTARNPGGMVTLDTDRGTVTVADASPGDELFVAISPEHVMLSLESPVGSARNVFVGPIEELVPEPPFGDRLRVVIGPAPSFVAEVTAAAAHQLGLAVGMRVHAAFKATSVSAYA
jgi:molybdate transport system ATP-binding protein